MKVWFVKCVPIWFLPTSRQNMMRFRGRPPEAEIKSVEHPWWWPLCYTVFVVDRIGVEEWTKPIAMSKWYWLAKLVMKWNGLRSFLHAAWTDNLDDEAEVIQGQTASFILATRMDR